MTGDQGASDRQLWLVPEEGRAQRTIVAEVAVETRTPGLHTYAVPAELVSAIVPGTSVHVPHGSKGRRVGGVCIRITEREWDHTLRSVIDVVASAPVLTAPLIELGLWISEYYACPPGLTLRALAPSGARRAAGRRLAYLRRTERVPSEGLTSKQQALLAAIAGQPQARRTLLATLGIGPGVAATLRRAGLLEIEWRHEAAPRGAPFPAQELPGACPEDGFALTPGQEAALREISAGLAAPEPFGVYLLFGVPGSGKTEVYVRAIRRVVASGRQAILLVPEIALATQVVDRLARRFERVAVFHGRLSAAVRRDTWQAVAAGQVDVVIGTRSAVFAPCPRLGLIVVDEEQDHSFKNLAAPHYHARDVAIKRAQLERVPCLLGSATPALETWHNAQRLPHYHLLRLPQRVAGARLPSVQLVDTSQRPLGQTTALLSPELEAAIAETLAAGQQAILLHNRRGYASFLRCGRCGLNLSCTRCSARLVYHQPDRSLRCHRCGWREPAPERCPDATCGGRLERRGGAIQRLEEELARVVPSARCQRLDRDTMRRREDYAAALRGFETGDADILLGTQMVAKGLDFPRVRLVGVVDADFALALPDLRAAEQVFQLVTQVVGRAGRREGASLAVVQTADVEAPAIRCALRMDYEAFATHELGTRRQFQYPPWTRLVRLVLADERPGRAGSEAERLAEALRDLAARAHPRVHVASPCPCVVARVRSMWRYELLLRGPRDASLQHLLRDAAGGKLLSPRVRRFVVDVDPLDLL